MQGISIVISSFKTVRPPGVRYFFRIFFRVSKTLMPRQTCYFFGTFNPIHAGHLLMAHQALGFWGERLGFETVTFIPAGNPPHRQGERGLLDAGQRFHLLEQAVYGFGHFRVSPLELQMAKEGLVTYTYETLQRLGAFDSQERCILLMGQDAFESLPDWYRGELLMKQCAFIVLERHDSAAKPGAEEPFQSRPHLMASFVAYHALKTPPIGISATYLRQLCRQAADAPMLRKRLTGLLPERALDYLLENKLYAAWQ